MSERMMLGGTDGHRGEFTEIQTPGLINANTFCGATYALGEYIADTGAENGPFVIAQDTRPFGDGLRHAAIDGALALGLEVIDLGVAPTPMAQKVAEHVGAMATVVVTASHNPWTDNGWKGMIGNRKPTKQEVRGISNRYWDRVESGMVIPRHTHNDSPEDADSYTAWYRKKVVNDIREGFGEETPLQGKIVVVDGANGAAQHITPDVLRDLGAKVEEYSCDGEGIINDGCGAADLSGLRSFLNARPELLKDPNFIGAVANDGDADRMMGIGVVHENGEPQLVEVNGNHVMGALGQGEPGIVGTEYTNTGLVRRLEAAGVAFAYCANGDVYVTQKLRELQKNGEPWRRGGEFTGHHVDTDWLPSGDGVRMAAWFATWAVRHGLTFGDVHQQMPLWPETITKIKFPGIGRETIKEDLAVQAAVAEAEAALGQEGRIVLRPSGTEPVVRIWGEGIDGDQVKRIVARLHEVVESRAA